MEKVQTILEFLTQYRKDHGVYALDVTNWSWDAKKHILMFDGEPIHLPDLDVITVKGWGFAYSADYVCDKESAKKIRRLLKKLHDAENELSVIVRGF